MATAKSFFNSGTTGGQRQAGAVIMHHMDERLLAPDPVLTPLFHAVCFRIRNRQHYFSAGLSSLVAYERNSTGFETCSRQCQDVMKSNCPSPTFPDLTAAINSSSTIFNPKTFFA